MMDINKNFQWQRFPKVEQFFLDALGEIQKQNSSIADFEEKLLKQTSTHLLGWTDHVVIKGNQEIRKILSDLGFQQEIETEGEVYVHSGVLLPGVVLTDGIADIKPGLAIRVESIADFLQTNGYTAEIEGTLLSGYRRVCVDRENDIAFYAVERRGSRALNPLSETEESLRHYLDASELWQKAPRFLDNEEQAYEELFKIAGDMIDRLGSALATHVIFEGERKYWLSRNYLARVQKGRQDTLGLGWANHDHHTFRSSRRHFSKLVRFFLRLEFQLRERFYAGKEAGWGAQVVEHPKAGIVLFLDVDLSPEELAIDFAAHDLPERDELGTVGLWCALHGDSLLKAGLHHLAGHFAFDRLDADLAKFGLGFMKPFSNFSYLKQAFSKGEIWEVDAVRVKRLVDAKLIDTQQADQFLSTGAVGSHLENLERHDGYKGFNQKNVSAIIHDTDPRHYQARSFQQ